MSQPSNPVPPSDPPADSHDRQSSGRPERSAGPLGGPRSLQTATLVEPEEQADGEWIQLTLAQPLMGVPQKTLYRWANDGKYPTKKDARGRMMIYVTRAELARRRAAKAADPVPEVVRRLLPEQPAPLPAMEAHRAVASLSQLRDGLVAPLVDRNRELEQSLTALALELGAARARIAQLEASQQEQAALAAAPGGPWARLWARWLAYLATLLVLLFVR